MGLLFLCTHQRWTPALPKPMPAKALARCMLALASRSSGFLMALCTMEANGTNEITNRPVIQEGEGRGVSLWTDIEQILKTNWEKHLGNGIKSHFSKSAILHLDHLSRSYWFSEGQASFHFSKKQVNKVNLTMFTSVVNQKLLLRSFGNPMYGSRITAAFSPSHLVVL